LKSIVLFDLDNTLLQNSLDTFLPGYLKAWMQFIAPHMPPELLISAMMGATEKATINQLTDCTLREVFDGHFYPALGFERREFDSLETQFYSEIFPTLRGLTQPVPGAVQIVNDLHLDGNRLALATNPLFPLTAILQRLDWAGFPDSDLPFEIVPSMESFHFAKPDIAFFAELLGRMGWPDTQPVMVGDSLERDIIPAKTFGIAPYWVNGGSPISEDGSEPIPNGEIQYVQDWIDRLPNETWQPTNTPTSLLATFRSTLAVLDTWSRDKDPFSWNLQPQLGEWSPVEILGHFHDVDREVNLPRLNKLLEENNPFLPGIDTDRWAKERDYRQKNSLQALFEFRKARLDLLQILENLQDADWQRPARHAIFGRTSLAELVSFMAGHDRLHIRQMYQALNEIPSYH
jgi:FMN phosphatase YigB (HAD superfamily)